MKYVKLFEQFVNEANELIKTQGLCKNAMFMAQKDVEALLKDWVKAELINSFKTKVLPYNNGYEMKLEYKYNILWKKAKELSPEEEIVSKFVFNNASIWIQPSSFFEENFEKGEGASLESRSLQLEIDQAYEITYPKWDIKDRKDMDKATKEFLGIIKDQVAQLRTSTVK